MCGRYAITLTVTEITYLFGTKASHANLQAHINACPSQALPVVHTEKGERVIGQYQWGLVPSWMKDPATGHHPINARAEEVETKPMFKAAFKQRRCLVPANLFYEWTGEKGKKQPYAIAMQDDAPFAFAGLWEEWRTQDPKETIRSFTILTCAANSLIAPLHPRMPVILPESSWSLWLHEQPSTEETLKKLLAPFPSDHMKTWKITTAINDVRNDTKDLLSAL